MTTINAEIQLSAKTQAVLTALAAPYPAKRTGGYEDMLIQHIKSGNLSVETSLNETKVFISGYDTILLPYRLDMNMFAAYLLATYQLEQVPAQRLPSLHASLLALSKGFASTKMYQHSINPDATQSRTVVPKEPKDFIDDVQLLELIADEEVSFSVYAGVITLIGRYKELKPWLSEDKKELLLGHSELNSIEYKGVMCTIKYKPLKVEPVAAQGSEKVEPVVGGAV